MEKRLHHSPFFVLFTILLSVCHSEQQQSSQSQALLRIQELLNIPDILSVWNSKTDFCNSEPNSSSTVVCYEGSITQLHIIGKKGAPLLPRSFSIDSFITTLVKLSDLKVLTLVSLGLWGPLPGKIARLSSLEILNMSSNFLYGSIPQELSSLKGLQTLILDDNMFSGQLPDWLSSFPLLAVLSLKKNSFNGSLPSSFIDLENLRVLSLSHNRFFGEVPDFSHLTNLQLLELEDNAFGPKFPRLGNKLVTLVLSKNKFRSGIPAEVTSYYQLQRLDLSFNTFVGPFPPSLLSLPSITYLNIAENKLTGMLLDNLSCNVGLKFVDLSYNFLTGRLPNCLQSETRDKVVLFTRNCLATRKQNQHPLPFCRNEALAVGILPERKNQKQASKAVLSLGIVGGILGGFAFVGIVFLIYRRLNFKSTFKKTPTRSITENASTSYSSKFLSDARYVSQTVKLGSLGLPGYRTFSLEELKEATNSFDTSSFMGEGSHGKLYRGQLKDGSLVVIRCLKMKKSHSTGNFMYHLELISKLRHRHLVSALGYCFEYYLDDSSVSGIFLVFEYVPNGTLRSWISDRRSRRLLTWMQRISAAIGIAKGIQYLHTVMRPGEYSNNLEITDILLDHNLDSKISCYNLPLLGENTGKTVHGISSDGSKNAVIDARADQEDKKDIYNFGVILLEIIKGRPIKSANQVDVLADQIQMANAADDSARRSIVDPAVNKVCLDQSLKTMMEICVRCLLNDPEDRPSIEDVLWNLQYAAQVQDAWRGEYGSSEGSAISP
ncbi:hypothetical protein FNV43_RR16907 [Rhamnella rubrinervis]|uniref:Protein kinase domain-containing protein n=1 Tax=Rhamnella rubrinervis TaxID=2594499 RepID=A0A8K0GZP0_9ROSA|nr:hypothetical protein FNV43_RR16907 [Rhamnella rubrinervis]